MFTKNRFCILICILLILILMFGGFALLYFRERLNNIQIIQNHVEESTFQESNEDVYQALVMLDMANKVEELTEGLITEQEKVIAIAVWVAQNISDRPGNFLEHPSLNNVFTWYAERAGRCGARSIIFIEMLKFANISAKYLALYDFPNELWGHACVQVWYDEGWHFFDVSYAGYFLDKTGNVLSFEEIVLNPEQALLGMVVIENSIDRLEYDSEGISYYEIIDNIQRMNDTYNLESLTDYKSYAFNDGIDVAEIYPTIDTQAELPLQLGKIDNSWIDVREDGLMQGIGQFISSGLADQYLIKSNWQFENCEVGKEYYLKYQVYNAQMEGSTYFAMPENAKIISGQNLILNNETTEWYIKFIPESINCSILIDYKMDTPGKGISIDKIEIGRIG